MTKTQLLFLAGTLLTAPALLSSAAGQQIRSFATSDLGPPPKSFVELTELSTLIVDATVQAVFPAREDRPPDALAEDIFPLATDSLLRISQVIKGQEVSSTVLVSQTGGETAGMITYGDSALFVPGERYILFLVPTREARKARLPNRNNVPWYDFKFGFISAVQVKDRRVELNKALPFREAYQGKNVDELLAEIRTIVSKR